MGLLSGGGGQRKKEISGQKYGNKQHTTFNIHVAASQLYNMIHMQSWVEQIATVKVLRGK